MAQAHKKLPDGQVKELMERYVRKEVERSHVEFSSTSRARRNAAAGFAG
jgi:hypothetical protein